MRLPRDLSGRVLAKQLDRQYGYRVTRTKGSHMTGMRTNYQAQAPPPRARRRSEGVRLPASPLRGTSECGHGG